MPELPTAFADLEPFAHWCLEHEPERYAKRLSSTMDELQAFYDAAFPRLGDAVRLRSDPGPPFDTGSAAVPRAIYLDRSESEAVLAARTRTSPAGGAIIDLAHAA